MRPTDLIALARDRLTLHLAGSRALLALSVFGVVTGLIAGIVIVAFRLLIEAGQMALLPESVPENFEALDPLLRVALPTLGGLLIGLALQALKADDRGQGVLHVMERLGYHQGVLPLRNALVQFFGAAASLISGHSLGREGPSVHLGAASGSLLAQWLALPHNCTRTLVACGVAAAIAASFNTPLAGVIFSMEVVLMEYTVAGFAPVILAAVSATSLMHVVFGNEHTFSVPPLAIGSLAELPLVLLMGVAIGALAALFVQLLQWFVARAAGRPLWLLTTLAGLITGLLGLAVPQVMGIGYDSLDAALLGQLGAGVLLGLLAAKLVATAACVGLGLPAGLIGPTLVMGAAAGGLGAIVVDQIAPGNISSAGFYAVLGMGAMMSATLHAPLAALTAMLELTADPEIILPGMLAVIASGLTSYWGFGKDSVFRILLQMRGLDYRADPVLQSLRRMAVAAVMNRRIALAKPRLSRAEAEALLADHPQWLVVSTEERCMLVPGADLARHLQQAEPGADVEIDLLAIPAGRLQAVPIDLRADLQEALDKLDAAHGEALYVTQVIAPLVSRTYGVITRQEIEASYRYHR